MTRSTDSFEDKNRTAALPSPEALIEQYAALVWKTIADYLDDPEDIKECVNDVFLAFYTGNRPYDPAKGSYASFLVAIARNKAVSRYLTLIQLLIAAVLSACAYIILRYFGVIPGYGINTDPDTVAYILEEEVTAEDALYAVTIKRAMLREDSLFIDIQIRNTDLPSDTEDESESLPSWAAQMESDLELMYAGEIYPHCIGQDVDYTEDSTGGPFLYSIAWNEKSEFPALIADGMNTKEALELTMTGKEMGFEIPFRLTPSRICRTAGRLLCGVRRDP